MTTDSSTTERKGIPINLSFELFTLLSPPDFLPTQPVDEGGRRLHLLPARVGVVEQVLHAQRRGLKRTLKIA